MIKAIAALGNSFPPHTCYLTHNGEKVAVMGAQLIGDNRVELLTHHQWGRPGDLITVSGDTLLFASKITPHVHVQWRWYYETDGIRFVGTHRVHLSVGWVNFTITIQAWKDDVIGVPLLGNITADDAAMVAKILETFRLMAGGETDV